MKKSLTINATRDGKKVAKSFGFVNPNVANSLVGGFAQMVNNLTTDTFVNAQVVKTMDTTEEETTPTPTPAPATDTDNRYQPTISNISAVFDSSSTTLAVSFDANYIPPTGGIDDYIGTIVVVMPTLNAEYAQGVAKIVYDTSGTGPTAKEFTTTFEIPSGIANFIKNDYYIVSVAVPEPQYANKAAVAVYSPGQV